MRQYVLTAFIVLSCLSVSGLTFSNDDKTLAAGFAERKIRIYALDSLKLLHTMEGHHSTVISIVLSKKNEIMVSTASF